MSKVIVKTVILLLELLGIYICSYYISMHLGVNNKTLGLIDFTICRGDIYIFKLLASLFLLALLFYKQRKKAY